MSDKINLNEIQEKVDFWITNHGGYWSPLSMMCAIIEEVGEVAREINGMEGFKPPKIEVKSDLEGELGDLLYSIICLANHYKINLQDAIFNTIKKYSKRDAKRFVK